MPLTPEQIAEIRKNAGVAPMAPKPGAAPTSLLDSLGLKPEATAAPEAAPEKPGYIKSVVDATKKSFSELPGKLQEDVEATGEEYQKAAKGGDPKALLKMAGKSLRVPGDVAGAIYSPIAAAISPLIERFTENAPQSVKDKYASIIGKISDSPELQKFATEHPNAAKDFERALNLAMSAGEKGTIEPKTAVKRTVDQVKGAVEKTAAVTEKVVSATVDVGNKAYEFAAEPASKYIQKKRGIAVDKLEADYEKWAGATKPGVKTLNRATAKTNKLNASGTEGKLPQRVLAENGVIPETTGTKFTTAEQANKFRQKAEPLQKLQKEAIRELDTTTKPVPVGDLEELAVRKVRTAENIANGSADKLEQQVRSEFASYRKNYGEDLTPSIINEIKVARSKGGKFDFTQPYKVDIDEAIRKAAQETIEDVAMSSGNEAVAQLNREIGDIMEASSFLGKLDGQTLKYGKIGKYVFTGIGSSLGTTIPGKILGAIGGDMIGDLLMRADVATPVKRLILKNLETTNPEGFKLVSQWLEEQGIMRDTRLALPEGNKQPIINQGRPIPAAPPGEKGREYIGPETSVGGYIPPNPPPGTSSPLPDVSK